MLDWWDSLTQDNQIKVLIVPVTALIGGLDYLLKKLFEKKQQSKAIIPAIQGDSITQTTHGGTAIINTGSGKVSTGDTYHIGITLEQYEQGLKRREVEVREEFKQAHAIDRQRLGTELQEIKVQLQYSKISFEAHITELKQLMVQVESFRGQIPDKLLAQAINALAIVKRLTSYLTKSMSKMKTPSKSLLVQPFNAAR